MMTCHDRWRDGSPSGPETILVPAARGPALQRQASNRKSGPGLSREALDAAHQGAGGAEAPQAFDGGLARGNWMLI